MTTTSRSQVRTALAQFFGGTTFDTGSRSYRGAGPLQASGLFTVRAYESKRTSDRDFTLNAAAGRGMGAYMIVQIPADVEIRHAKTGGTGKKLITYQAVLDTYHLAYLPYAEDAEQDVDVLAEAIKDLIRANPSMSNAAGIFEAGETGRGIVTRINPSDVYNEHTRTYFQLAFDVRVEIVA